MLRILVLTSVASVLRTGLCTVTALTSNTATMALKATDFEVFGKVQGVFFRKHTKQEADKLGLKGWCLNTSKGTVQGHIEGPNEKIESMMNWLKTTGSPSSRIDKAEFRNQKDIERFTVDDFQIRKDA